MFDAYAYTITVRRVKVDDEELFRATVAEFPDLEPDAPTFAEAYELAIDAIETLHSMYEEEGRKFPAPNVEEREFSGRVTLRIPKSVHRGASMIATTEGVSLNQWLVSIISQAVGSGTAVATGPSHVRMLGLLPITSASGQLFRGPSGVVNSMIVDASSGVLVASSNLANIDLAFSFPPSLTKTAATKIVGAARKPGAGTPRKIA